MDGIGQITHQKIEIEGLEISANYHFESDVSTGLAYSKLEGRNIAPDRVNLYVEAPFVPNWHGRLQFSRLLDRDFEGGLPQHNFDGYDLLDAVISYRNAGLGNFILGIENLLDEDYISYYSQTLTYVNNSTCFAGRGRAVTVGWEKAF